VTIKEYGYLNKVSLATDHGFSNNHIWVKYYLNFAQNNKEINSTIKDKEETFYELRKYLYLSK